MWPDIKDVKKILIHQANEKMDEAIIKRFYQLYKTPMPEDIMPMSIHKLGNCHAHITRRPSGVSNDSGAKKKPNPLFP